MNPFEKPPKLADLQKWFGKMICHPEHPEDFLQNCPHTSAWIHTHSHDLPQDRLSVYRDGYYIRNTDALRDTYPIVCQLIGPKRFANVCFEYTTTHPAETYNLNRVGKGMSTFLKNSDPTKQFPVLVDLAHFEWTINCAFHAQVLQPLMPHHISNSDETLILHLQPHVHTVTSRFPLHTWWDAYHANKPFPPCRQTTQKHNLLIYRKEGFVTVTNIPKDAFRILTQIQMGKSLAVACASVQMLSSDDIQRWFSGWMRDRVFAL